MSKRTASSSTSPQAPPKLPPRTYRKSVSTEPSPTHSRPAPKVVDDTEYSADQLISEKHLPQMVAVSLGYDGATPDKCVYVGDEFVISFAKSTTVLPAKLDGGADEVQIPIDSMLSVGVVRKDGGRCYSTVKDLLKLSDLPLAVVVNHAFTLNSFRVDKGSVLYVKGQDGKSALFCQHEGGQELTLTPDVMGKFSTDPEEATIYIADYTTLFNIYPITVKLLQKGVDVDDHLSQYIGQNFVLEQPIVKLSLIATTDVNGTKIDSPVVVEIPMDIPLYYKCIERPEVDMESVYKSATKLCEEFNPGIIDVQYGTCVVTENDYAETYATIDNDPEENYYVSFDIICPNPRTETLKKALEKQRSKNTAEPASETPPAAQRSKKRAKKSDKKGHNTASERTPYYNVPPDENLAFQLVAEKDKVKKLTDESNQLNDKMEQLTVDNDQLTKEVDTLKLQLHYSKQSCTDLEAELGRVNKNISRLNGQLEQLAEKKQLDPASSMEENQERLQQLSAMDVTELLKRMGYQMYEKDFAAECVDGMLLSTLEEEHLKELGIKNSIHCRRLMNIIQGKESVDKYFKV